MSDERRDDRAAHDAESGRDSWLERLMHRFNLRPRESVREDLAEVLAEATEAADLTPRERAMLSNVLAFHEVRVGDVMVPRADIVALPSDTPLGELLALFRKVGHSRLPVFGESLDEPLGMIHIRDLVDYLVTQALPEAVGEVAQVTSLGGVDLSRSVAAASILRPVLFVPGSMPAIELLARMQASRTHIALVIDEYGGTDGLVSMEDLVETVVGDIEDEHDETANLISRDDRGDFLVDARASLDEVSAALGFDLSEGADADDVDTVGGLVVTQAGRVPLRGEVFSGPEGVSFEVMDADRRRLKRLRIRIARPEADDPAHGTGDARTVSPAQHDSAERQARP
jgi:CBS domain containing-hemolysin-like protein